MTRDSVRRTSDLVQVGFEEARCRRTATQPRVPRTPFLGREPKQGLESIQHPGSWAPRLLADHLGTGSVTGHKGVQDQGPRPLGRFLRSSRNDEE